MVTEGAAELSAWLDGWEEVGGASESAGSVSGWSVVDKE